MASRAPGRPPGGNSDLRRRILMEAAARFSQRGYDATTIRGVAAAAGVDPALVRYHFGSKAGLLTEVLGLRFAPADVLAVALRSAPPHRMAERLLALVILSWEEAVADSGMRGVVVQALHEPETRVLFGEYITTEVVGRLEEALPGTRRRERAAAAIGVLIGMIMGRYVLSIPAYAVPTPNQVFRQTLPALRSALASPEAGRV